MSNIPSAQSIFSEVDHLPRQCCTACTLTFTPSYVYADSTDTPIRELGVVRGLTLNFVSGWNFILSS